MHKSELKSARIFASIAGGDIRCISLDGEILWELGVSAEILKGRELMPYVHPTDTIELTGGLTAFLASGERVHAQPAYDTIESGANPDWTPTNYTEAEVRLRKLIKDVESKSDALQKRQKSFENASNTHKPKLPADSDPEPVIESKPVSEPSPDPDLKPKDDKPSE